MGEYYSNVKKFLCIKKEAVTCAKEKKASREWMTKHQRKNYWELCIYFLLESQHFGNFVKTNKKESKLHVVAANYRHEKDIAKLEFTLFHYYISDIAVNL